MPLCPQLSSSSFRCPLSGHRSFQPIFFFSEETERMAENLNDLCPERGIVRKDEEYFFNALKEIKM